jgi:hypothetical protein
MNIPYYELYVYHHKKLVFKIEKNTKDDIDVIYSHLNPVLTAADGYTLGCFECSVARKYVDLKPEDDVADLPWM